MHWYTLLLLILASYRLTHLLVFDSIAEPLRKWLGKAPFLGQLINCYWCCGVWVSAGLVGFYSWSPTLARPVLLIFAVAAGQALLETWTKRE